MPPLMRLAALTACCVVVSPLATPTLAEEFRPIKRRTPIVAAVAKVRPGVVSLKVTRRDDWGSKREVMGTGIIVDERGYVLTNRHVAYNALSIVATLYDGTKHQAVVEVLDASNDLAILRLPTSKRLPALTFGPGNDLMLGETIIAVGNPYGFDGTVTTGIISGLNRTIEVNEEKLTRVIQTNAAINPGNSGGPLININGEVIGVVVALRDGAQCIAFAINAETAKSWLVKHLNALKVSKVTHGLVIQEQVEEEGKDRQKVVVQEVLAQTRAGLRPGDIIVQIGSLKVNNRFDVERAVWGFKPGDKLETTVVREGEIRKVSLTLTDEAAIRTVSTR
ncbi:MAG: trypsin-like peptidase domain-containing protein [Gemmataceae bacterium]